MRWTKRVVRDPAIATATPKRWFDSDATTAKALGATTSPEAMVKLLFVEKLLRTDRIAAACFGERARDARRPRGAQPVAHAQKDA
jgi:hypothetical protein